MKSAVVLLAAVTVFTTLFLECSSSEPKQDCLSDALKQLVSEKSKRSDNALDKFIYVVESALAKASDEYKKGLTVVSDFLKEFKPEVTEIHTELKKIIESGSCNGLDELVGRAEVDIKGLEETLASFKNLKLPLKVRESMKENMEETLVPDAKEVIKKLRKA